MGVVESRRTSYTTGGRRNGGRRVTSYVLHNHIVAAKM